MAAFYLDNDVSLALAPLLQEYGHDVTSTRDLRLFRAGDVDQLHTAVRNGWVLVTYNRRDFTLLHDAWRTWPTAFGLALPPHRGILALDPGPAAELAGSILALAATTSPSTWANELLWWRRFEWRSGEDALLEPAGKRCRGKSGNGGRSRDAAALMGGAGLKRRHPIAHCHPGA